MINISREIEDYQTKNPDKLSSKELELLMLSLVYTLGETLGKSQIERIIGQEEATRLREEYSSLSPQDRLHAEILESDFVDYYQIFPTPSQAVYEKVIKYFPREQFKRVLCVGDGRRCHLGRKLASDGYEVVCMDPLSSRVVGESFDHNNGGKLKIVSDYFNSRCQLLPYVDVVVGSKIPDIAADVVNSGKPYVFTTSLNPGVNSRIVIHGVTVTSYQQMDALLRGAPGIRVEKQFDNPRNLNIYIRGGLTRGKDNKAQEI